MDLYDILACPRCKVSLHRREHGLLCRLCKQTYPIVNGIPVVLLGGEVPEIHHEAELAIRSGYNPWVHRLILQSLTDSQIAVEVGAGNMALDDPCIIRTDVTLSPYVDLVADVHALPFLPGSIDYIFSLAVFEHLRQPFLAAKSIHDSLKDGGYIYHECNFVFAYHGYPHHYFNATLQGMGQIFSDFLPLRKGVATYQMPSFALDSVLRSYLHNTQAGEYPHGRRLVKLLGELVDLNLVQYDVYFSESGALNVAAGTYFAGMKKNTPTSTVIPRVIEEVWTQNRSLQVRFPDITDLTQADNIMAWAFSAGRAQYPQLEQYFQRLKPFNKRGEGSPFYREPIRSLPFEDAPFGAIGFSASNSMAENSRLAQQRFRPKAILPRLHDLIASCLRR